MHIDEFVAKSQGTQIGGSVVDDKVTISNTVSFIKFILDVFFLFWACDEGSIVVRASMFYFISRWPTDYNTFIVIALHQFSVQYHR